MITGVINANLEATIQLVVQDINGQLHQIDAVIDTGFTGFLTLSSSLTASLGLPWLCRQQGFLADGSTQVFDVYVATVIWDGQARTVEVDAVDTDPLVGMGLIYGHELRIQAVDGGTVIIEALP